MMTSRDGQIRGEHGFALIPTVLVLILFVALGAGALRVSGLDLRSTAHYRTGNEAFYTAEAGLVHALSTINTRGVQSFQAMVERMNVGSICRNRLAHRTVLSLFTIRSCWIENTRSQILAL